MTRPVRGQAERIAAAVGSLEATARIADEEPRAWYAFRSTVRGGGARAIGSRVTHAIVATGGTVPECLPKSWNGSPEWTRRSRRGSSSGLKIALVLVLR